MITAYIRGQKLLLDPPELASDSRNFLETEFCLPGRDWDGYAKTAYFTSGGKALVHQRHLRLNGKSAGNAKPLLLTVPET